MSTLSATANLAQTAVDAATRSLQQTGRLFYRRNWSVGTSSNYSVRLQSEPFLLLVTASGKDKGRLTASDFVILDRAGVKRSSGPGKSSAETALHLMLTESPEVGAVLHTHSVFGTILSDLHGDNGGFWIDGLEMLKGLAGVTTHEHREWVPIFPNSQDIPDLARKVRDRWDSPTEPPFHGFLLRNHGLYTWGQNIAEARRHVEIFEFLFEVLVTRYRLRVSV